VDLARGTRRLGGEVAGIRLGDLLDVELAGAHVVDAELAGARCGDLRHLGRHVGEDDLAPRRHPLRRREAEAARTAGQLEHALARL
jgi:hypothetical protein